MDTQPSLPESLPRALLGVDDEVRWADPTLHALVSCSASGSCAPQWDSLLDEIRQTTVQVRDQGVAGVHTEPIRLFVLDEAGRPMETYWLAALSPQSQGAVWLSLVQVTRRVVVERRWATVQALVALERIPGRGLVDTGRAILQTLATNRISLPWAMCYVDSGQGLTLVDAYGLRREGRLALPNLDAAPVRSSRHPVEHARAVGTGRLVLSGPWVREVFPGPLGPTPPARGALLHLASYRTGRELGLLVVGLNPYRPDEELFSEFLRLVRNQARGALGAAEADARAAHLRVALESNRTIGTAIGIVMAREHLTEKLAFARLRQVSNELNRRIVDIADHVVLTGALPGSPAVPHPASPATDHDGTR